MLTQGDYKLLSCFLDNPGKILSREELMEKLDTSSRDLHSINVRIRRLREKLGDGKDHSYIQAVRNEGYIWTMPLEAGKANAQSD